MGDKGKKWGSAIGAITEKKGVESKGRDYSIPPQVLAERSWSLKLGDECGKWGARL